MPRLWQEKTHTEEAAGDLIASDTWLMIETLDHGLNANDMHPIRWVVDAVRLLQYRPESIDWQMFVDIVKRNKLQHRCYLWLKCVAHDSPHIPQFVLEALGKTRVNYLDREELKVRLSVKSLDSGFISQNALNKLRKKPSKTYYTLPASPLDKNLGISVMTKLTFAGRNIFTRILFPLWYH